MAAKGLVARGDFKVVITQLDANRFSRVAFALQVRSQLAAQLGKYRAQGCLVAHRMQVTVKRGFTAHADGLAAGDHRALVPAPGHVMHPRACGFAEPPDQKISVLRGQLADGLNTVLAKLFISLGTYAIDLSALEWPDSGL